MESRILSPKGSTVGTGPSTENGCLSKLRELQKRRLVLLWRTRSLPTAMPDGRFFEYPRIRLSVSSLRLFENPLQRNAKAPRSRREARCENVFRLLLLFIFCPSFFCQSVFLFPHGKRGQKNGGRKNEKHTQPSTSLGCDLNNFVKYCTHGITNATAERITSKIISIKRSAGYYREIDNFKKSHLVLLWRTRSPPTVVNANTHRCLGTVVRPEMV